MASSSRPLSKKELADLRGYVAWPIALFRAVLFVVVVGGLGAFLRVLHARIFAPGSPFAHPAWWIAPTVIFATALYVISRRWTGGRGKRAKIRADIRGGVAEVQHFTAVDAIEVAPGGDEGPTFFLLLGDGRTLVLSGQYLERYTRKGFPWTAFEIGETPEARMFLDIRRTGDKLTPSMRRPALTWEQVKRFGIVEARYRILDEDFARIKGELSEVPAG